MFCKNCGHEMSEEATSCPSCGHPVEQKGKKNKTVFVLLALFFGGFGIHRFYLGDIWLGLGMCVLLLFGISPFIALVEAIVIGLRKDDPRFA